VILSVTAIAASGAAGSTPGKLKPPESGHLNLAKSGHYYLAATRFVVDNLCYVKLKSSICKFSF
jgi:hypothetical protein